jgi:hypothetical protein
MNQQPNNLQRLMGVLDSAGEDARDLRAAVEAVLAGKTDSLDEALGLKPTPGSRSWRTAEALARRDSALRGCAARYGLGPADLMAGLGRYFSVCWPRDRTAAVCPDRLTGKPGEFYWLALKAWPRPVRERQLRSILKSEIGNELAVFIAADLDDIEPKGDERP